MPLINLPDMLQFLRDKVICSYSVDTNIFFKKRFNFINYPLQGLLNLNRNVKFVLPDIIYREIENNFIEHVNSNFFKLKNSLSNLLVIKEASKMHDYINSVDCHTFCKEILSTYFNPISQYIIKCSTYCKLDSILDSYFNNYYPFSKKDNKKNEFPDALALNCLENWSNINNNKLLFLTEDKSCMQYCLESNNIYAIKLNDDHLSKVYFDICINNIKYFDDTSLEGLSIDIKKSIISSDQFKNKLHDTIESFLYDMQDINIEAYSAYYYDFDIDEFELLNVFYDEIIIDIINSSEYTSNNPIDVNVHVLINFLCTATFIIYVYDSIDKEYIPIDSKSKSVDKLVELDIQIRLSNYHPEMILYDECILALNISGNRIDIDFGEIQQME